ncbi:MAG: thioesterase family protein [Propionicimonas sp.]
MSSFVTEVPLRWVDLDAQGHVNNALVVDYLQEARVAFLLSGANAHLLGTSAVVVSHAVEFLRPIEYTVEPVAVEVSVCEVGAARYGVAYEVRQAGNVVARARTGMCVFDFAANRPRRLTPQERGWFAGRQQDSEPLRPLARFRVGEAAHSHELAVRWSDLDSYGHVNNVKLFDYLAEARIRMNPGYPELTRMHHAAAADLRWMVVRQDVEYRGQITHRLEPYLVRTAYASLGRTSMTLVAQVEDPLAPGTLLGRAQTVLVCGDAAGRPVPIPEEIAGGAAVWPAVPLA